MVQPTGMTCVYLTINQPDAPEQWQPDPEPRLQFRGPGLASILLVEDDETVREVICRVLQDAGYDVANAGDGVEALNMMEGLPAVDLLITDIRMPRMGGHELSNRVLDARPDLPIIYISGYVADWDPRVAPGRARAFLRKPFSVDDLLGAVEKLLPQD